MSYFALTLRGEPGDFDGELTLCWVKNVKITPIFTNKTKLYCILLMNVPQMGEYHKIAYSMNIVSLFLVTYGASCEFVDDLYSIK